MEGRSMHLPDDVPELITICRRAERQILRWGTPHDIAFLRSVCAALPPSLGSLKILTSTLITFEAGTCRN
jgi:hypothetical protein